MPDPDTAFNRVLLIPDVHQHVAWAERVLNAGADCDQVIFLGDYFDTGEGDRASIAETCEFLVRTQERLGDRVVFLLGNHDVQYLEAKPYCDRFTRPRHLKYTCGSAYANARAKKVAKHLPAAFWAAARLATFVNGWLISHAGVARPFWPEVPSPDAALATVLERCANALAQLRGFPDPLLLPGTCRGGTQPVGGITWQDWDDEFNDAAIPFPQIVGHTSNPVGPRQKGRSWCLDGCQTSFGILTGSALQLFPFPP
jgi:3',5'-cyclic AMP phosphodiesterase CpdA